MEWREVSLLCSSRSPYLCWVRFLPAALIVQPSVIFLMGSALRKRMVDPHRFRLPIDAKMNAGLVTFGWFIGVRVFQQGLVFQEWREGLLKERKCSVSEATL